MASDMLNTNDQSQQKTSVNDKKSLLYWPNADEEIRSRTEKKAKDIYGSTLPTVVRERLDKELKGIIGNGYAPSFLFAAKLVADALSDGCVISCGYSVGASFVAFLLNITEVNPLPPHYICSKCGYFELNTDSDYGTGLDLPSKPCPKCGSQMTRDGFDIPSESFQALDGSAKPLFCLNSSETYAEKLIQINEHYVDANFERHALIQNMVELRHEKLYLFLFKWQTLVPLRKLQDRTGISLHDIPLQNPEVLWKILSLLKGSEVLGIPSLESKTGESFLSIMKEIPPTSLDDLIRIYSISRSDGAWTDNALRLIKAGIPLKKYICSKEDIFQALVAKGIDRKMAFRIMEFVFLHNKGRRWSSKIEDAIRAADMAWYIDSCKEVKSLRPRAESVADVMTILRLAYFKIYYPKEFYTVCLERYAAPSLVSRDRHFAGTKTVDELLKIIDEFKEMIEENVEAFYEGEIEEEDLIESFNALSQEIDMLKTLIEMKKRGIQLDLKEIFEEWDDDDNP